LRAAILQFQKDMEGIGTKIYISRPREHYPNLQVDDNEQNLESLLSDLKTVHEDLKPISTGLVVVADWVRPSAATAAGDMAAISAAHPLRQRHRKRERFFRSTDMPCWSGSRSRLLPTKRQTRPGLTCSATRQSSSGTYSSRPG
jgi:hypothetical protein